MDRAQWNKLDSQLVSRRIAITKSDINGKSIGQLRLRNLYGINVTRKPCRCGLVAEPRLKLQIGDRVTVVGSEASIAEVEQSRQLSEATERANLISIFIGISLGVLWEVFLSRFPESRNQ